MPSTRKKRPFDFKRNPKPIDEDAPIIRGRPLIEGSDRLQFPAFYREERKPVTFRSADAYRSREEREDYVFAWIERVRREKRLVTIMIPHGIYSGEGAIFHAGWTLSERDGEIRTRQCVVLLAGDAVPIGRADQGVVCVVRRDKLSAWDGRTEDQSRALAA